MAKRAASKCPACGKLGHRSRDGKCSKAYRAAVLVMTAGVSRIDAAERLGIAPRVVNRTLNRMGVRQRRTRKDLAK